MRSLTLTEKQKEIVDFIRDYRERRGISPTQREICEKFGYSSFGTLQKHIRLLLEKGILKRDWNRRRSLVLAEELEPPARQLPVFGRIAAGHPIEVLPGEDTIAVPDVLTPRGDSYVLKVNGSSMIEDGIHDGDYVVIQKKERADNGEMVVALLNGEATLKRYYREADGRIRLQPANAAMTPFFAREDDVRVQGIVVGLMRRY